MSKRLVLEQTGDGWRVAGAGADRFALVNDYLPPVEWERRHAHTHPIASPMAA